MKKRTPQEIADFFECYVARNDWCREWNAFKKSPQLSFEYGIWEAPFKSYWPIDDSAIRTPKNHNWRKLYRPYQEPIIVKEDGEWKS